MSKELNPASGCTVEGLVRAQCLKAIRDYRNYRRIHPEAFQVWACSERKGAMLLARRISRILSRPNAMNHQQEEVRCQHIV